MIQKQGFTLIELVIVIVLLGILAATALPKFANMTVQARLAAAQGVSGAMAGAVSISHAQWLAQGSPSGTTTAITLDGNTSVYMSTTGWPENTSAANGTMTATKCLNVWNAILQGPPNAGTTCTGTCQYLVVAPTASTCNFRDQQGATGFNQIAYDITTGVVTSP